MQLNLAQIYFQLIAFLFAISLHEAAHAWTASRCGDPTARMLGRVTLNPIKHIDPVGTVLMPLIAFLTHLPVFGWAKPTPVTTSNLKNPVRDDILVSVAGPASNFLTALVATVVIRLLFFAGPHTIEAFENAWNGNFHAQGLMTPVMFLLVALLQVNVVLGVFNLIPVPPLDGSHVFRHLLSGTALRVYDSMGMIGLLLLVYFGGRFLMMVINPVFRLYISLLSIGLNG